MQPTANQIKKLVSFYQDNNGDWHINHVMGNIEGQLLGSVRGNVWGTVVGNIHGELQGKVLNDTKAVAK